MSQVSVCRVEFDAVETCVYGTLGGVGVGLDHLVNLVNLERLRHLCLNLISIRVVHRHFSDDGAGSHKLPWSRQE
jgi:hypothetical protein